MTLFFFFFGFMENAEGIFFRENFEEKFVATLTSHYHCGKKRSSPLMKLRPEKSKKHRSGSQAKEGGTGQVPSKIPMVELPLSIFLLYRNWSHFQMGGTRGVQGWDGPKLPEARPALGRSWSLN